MTATPTEPSSPPAERRRVRVFGRMRIVAVWVVALVLMIGVGFGASTQRQLTWVSISMMMLVLLTGLLQLADGRSAGFIHRFALSLAGAAIILAVATVVFMVNGAQSWVSM